MAIDISGPPHWQIEQMKLQSHFCNKCEYWNESTQKCEPIPDCGGMSQVLPTARELVHKMDIPKTTSTTTTTTTIATNTTNNTKKYLLYIGLGILAFMILKKKK